MLHSPSSGGDPYDTAEARELIEFLDGHGVPYRRYSPYHYKIHKINYYLPKGKIILDGVEKHDLGRGLKALEVALRRSRYISPSAFA